MTTPQRALKPAMHTAHSFPPDLGTDLRDWLTAQAHERSLRWLLAHTDAGVIWGEYREDEDGKLHLSHEALPHAMPVPISLDWLTLQQARLFDVAGEVRLWHDGQQWHATLLTDQQANDATGYYFDEPHLLWGWWLERDDESAAGFFLL
ncbi:MAG: hypothetical protein HC911_16115, partial [Chloroflexaceae bacterium]|nr:hypothetical protein [Chloroflexaceae bacterium]